VQLIKESLGKSRDSFILTEHNILVLKLNSIHNLEGDDVI